MIIGGRVERWATPSVSGLLVSTSTDLGAVLLSDTLVNYLQSLQSIQTVRAPQRGSESSTKSGDGGLDNRSNDVHVVLQYIKRHADTLFDLLHGKACVEVGLVRRKKRSQGGSPAVSTWPTSAPASTGIVEAPRPLKELHAVDPRSARDVPDGCRNADSSATAAAPSGIRDDDEARDRLCIANLTELLSFCIANSPNQAEIRAIVAACTTALSEERTLEPQRSFAVQRLLLEAFDSDFELTTQAIADTLTHAIIVGVVENLANNSIIAETLIALFGSALSAVWMVKPTTKTALFTSQWIELKFPTTLCAYLPIAIRDPGMYHYFYFFKELLKRGYSHSAGPIVDVLLSEPLVSEYVENILSCCEEDVERSLLLSPDGAAAAPVSLAADGMEVLVSITSLVRKSLVLPETASMYEAATRYITPLAVLQAEALRVAALLAPTAREKAEMAGPVASTMLPQRLMDKASRGISPTALPSGEYGLSPLRLAVCELFVEFSFFQLASTDETLITSGFFPALIRCCERFPQHDALARTLHRCILTVFHRPTLLGESLSTAAERDCLWKYLVQADTVALQCGALVSVIGALTHFAQVPDTSLSSLCIDALMNLASLALFQSAAGGPFEQHLETFKACEVIQERVRHMAAPITGQHFMAHGAARLPESVHRDTVNLAGDRFSGLTTGGFPGGTRPSVPSEADDNAYIIVHHSTDDDQPKCPVVNVSVDMKALKEEVLTLQQAGSPAVQSYPSFSDVNINFFSSLVAEDHQERQCASAASSSEPHCER
ncbi:hypothetical protein JKF63_02501 [Porcisia hertigi]|uniref:Uncharacterized protein n=1 Tax=Porcisia hertigi TaxID=2761500 RepID=A0A836I442_9TRYP|nr:hypothetical protein JKF63_02501 [Porcisia hertigi]